MICSYYLELCNEVPGATIYIPYSAEDFKTNLISNVSESDYDDFAMPLDEVYEEADSNPDDFNILWITDPLIDFAYEVGGSKTCSDESCCHGDIMAKDEDDMAGAYGCRECHFNLDGFKRMVDYINA